MLKFYFSHNLLDAKESKFFNIKCFMFCGFHVKHSVISFVSHSFAMKQPVFPAYLPISTSITLMSLGETPGMRLAWARVSGSMRSSFWRPSVEIS